MVILPLLFTSLFAFSLPQAPQNAPSDFKTYLVTEVNERGNYTLTGVNGFTENEFRLYHYSDLLIDEVSDTAFNGTTFSSIMLTNSVTHINDAVFNNAANIKKMYFTGSEEEFSSLGLTYEFTSKFYYSKDEGFINYWNKEIRPYANSNICDISKDKFTYVYSLYKNLSNDDLTRVDAHVDYANARIKDSMKELVRVFTSTSPSKKIVEWNQAGAITLIIFIAVLGMTSITVFFLLKTKHLIN